MLIFMEDIKISLILLPKVIRKLSVPLVLILLSGVANAQDSLSAQEAGQVLAQIRDRCAPYEMNGVRFWNGDYKSASNAPGLMLLNKEIQRSVRGASNAKAAQEIAWQKCLDFVFNNENSKAYSR